MKVVRLSALHTGCLYPPRKYSWYSFLFRGRVDPRAVVGLEGLCHWKIPVTPLGIEPMTIWLVAQCLNQMCHRVLWWYWGKILNSQEVLILLSGNIIPWNFLITVQVCICATDKIPATPCRVVSCFYFMTETEPASKILYVKWHRVVENVQFMCLLVCLLCCILYPEYYEYLCFIKSDDTHAPLQVWNIWLPCRM